MRVAVASRHGLWEALLMYDLAAIGIAAACLLLMFALVWALERV